jgi:hypothetical protein
MLPRPVGGPTLNVVVGFRRGPSRRPTVGRPIPHDFNGFFINFTYLLAHSVGCADCGPPGNLIQMGDRHRRLPLETGMSTAQALDPRPWRIWASFALAELVCALTDLGRIAAVEVWNLSIHPLRDDRVETSGIALHHNLEP